MEDLHEYDKLIAGTAYTSVELYRNLVTLCDEIGSRWTGTTGEEKARTFLTRKLEEYGLEDVNTERFETACWYPEESRIEFKPELNVVEGVKSVPLIYSPSAEVEGEVVYVGHGTPREFEARKEKIRGNIVLTTNKAFPPFTSVETTIEDKYRWAVELGAAGMIIMNERNLGNLCFTSLIHWFRREDGTYYPIEKNAEIPCVSVSKELGERMKREISKGGGKLKAAISTKTSLKKVSSYNVVGDLKGEECPEEELIICAIDNASGVCVLLGIAEALSKLRENFGKKTLKRTLRFIAFSAEELGLKGSLAYVERHREELRNVRLVINMDELAAGRLKGFRLQFPELVPFFQELIDDMGLPLTTHLEPFVDTTSDHFPFTLNGVPIMLLWRWRYVGEYPTHQYTHTEADTIDKIELKDLHEYVSTVARCALRVVNTPRDRWPATHHPREEILKLLEKPVTPY